MGNFLFLNFLILGLWNPILLKTDTRSFNHRDDFAIENGFLWYRNRNGFSNWEKIPFDGIPKKLSADGANLLVIDDQNQVHFKKVLKELNGIDNSIDLSSENNWEDKWFCFSNWHYLVNIIAGRFLYIDPKEYPVSVISHRGRYNDYIEDHVKQKHPVETGVTTIYALSSDGRKIRMFDPWVPKHAEIAIYFPFTENHFYQGLNISASASTIMSIGYDFDLNSGMGQLQILTKLSDIDSEGWSPLINYAYEKDDKDPETRVLPTDPNWKVHPLPYGAQVTKHITIFQNGKGNDSRELRVEGCLSSESCGYFHKQINESEWQFKNISYRQQFESKTTNSQFIGYDFQSDVLKSCLNMPLWLCSTSIGVQEQQHQKVIFRRLLNNVSKMDIYYLIMKDFLNPIQKVNLEILQNRESQNFPAVLKFSNVENIKANLTQFGPEIFQSLITFDYKGKTYSWNLYRVHTLWSFIGFHWDQYDLVIPKEDQMDDAIKKLFPNFPISGFQAFLKDLNGTWEISI